MRRACFSRREEANRRREAQSSNAPQNVAEAEGDVPCDVLEKQPFEAVDFSDDTRDVGPKVAGIVLALALPGLAERLAGVASQERVGDSVPRPAAEPLEVIPDWCRVKISGCLGGGEDGAGVFVDVAEHGAGKARLGKAKAHVKAAAARTEGDTDRGSECHVMRPPWRRRSGRASVWFSVWKSWKRLRNPLAALGRISWTISG
jgi:hypothetical protein